MNENKTNAKQTTDHAHQVKDATQGLSKEEVTESLEELNRVAESDEMTGASSATYDEY